MDRGLLAGRQALAVLWQTRTDGNYPFIHVTVTQRDKETGMEAKTKTFIKTSVDDNGMWLLTVPAGSAGNETVVVVVRRVEECRYGSEDSRGHICGSPVA